MNFFPRMLAAALFTGILVLASPQPGVASGASWKATASQEGEPAQGESRELLYKTINFVILVAALGYLLRKPASAFFRDRTAGIHKALDEGRKALAAAEARLREVETKLQGLEDEISALKASATREMAQERDRLRRAAAEESKKIQEFARARMEAATRAAKMELRRHATNEAIRLGEQMVRERLDAPGHARLVDQFVRTLGASRPEQN